MDVTLRCAEDISLQVHIPNKVSVDEFLGIVERLEHVIARKKPSSTNQPLPSFKQQQARPAGVDERLGSLEQSTKQIVELLNQLSQ